MSLEVNFSKSMFGPLCYNALYFSSDSVIRTQNDTKMPKNCQLTDNIQ